MPEWITPLLRVLAPMPSLGICSTRNTSLQRSETARATAQPTRPPPMMTMFARSTAHRILDAGGWRLASLCEGYVAHALACATGSHCTLLGQYFWFETRAPG